jgi:hypothetical protein
MLNAILLGHVSALNYSSSIEKEPRDYRQMSDMKLLMVRRSASGASWLF